MSNKLLAFLVVFCLLNASFAYRLPRSVDFLPSSGEKSSEEFTASDLTELRAELEKQLPKDVATRIGDIFAKLTEDQPDQKQAEAIVQLLGLIIRGALVESDETPATPIVITFKDIDLKSALAKDVTAKQ